MNPSALIKNLEDRWYEDFKNFDVHHQFVIDSDINEIGFVTNTVCSILYSQGTIEIYINSKLVLTNTNFESSLTNTDFQHILRALKALKDKLLNQRVDNIPLFFTKEIDKL